jgi:hypothetical protein
LSQDAGGLSREFFTTLMQRLLDPNLGLFNVATTTEFSYKINEDSTYIDNHHTLFFFFGKTFPDLRETLVTQTSGASATQAA